MTSTVGRGTRPRPTGASETTMLKPQNTMSPARLRRRRQWPHRLVAVVLILAGAVVSLLPVAETFVNNAQGAQASGAYARAVEQASPSQLGAALSAAQEYNRRLAPTALADPWSDEQEANSASHDAYRASLNSFGPLGRIRIPEISVDLPILHDATRKSLGQGAGHMYGTSLPVGGTGSHSVIAGHTGSRVRTYFDRLKEITAGDTFFIDVAGRTLGYRVDQISVVYANDLSKIQPVDGQDLVTLVTCIQGREGEGKRLLVRGVRDLSLAAASTNPSTSSGNGGAGSANGDGASTSSANGDAATQPAGGVHNALQVPAAIDLSIQEWMWPRLAVSGAALILLLAMAATWIRGSGSAPRRSLSPDAPTTGHTS